MPTLHVLQVLEIPCNDGSNNETLFKISLHSEYLIVVLQAGLTITFMIITATLNENILEEVAGYANIATTRID